MPVREAYLGTDLVLGSAGTFGVAFGRPRFAGAGSSSASGFDNWLSVSLSVSTSKCLRLDAPAVSSARSWDRVNLFTLLEGDGYCSMV